MIADDGVYILTIDGASQEMTGIFDSKSIGLRKTVFRNTQMRGL